MNHTTQEENCCAKCYDDDDLAPPCCDKNCECHTTQEEEWDADVEITKLVLALVDHVEWSKHRFDGPWLERQMYSLLGRARQQAVAEARKEWENEPMSREHYDNITRPVIEKERERLRKAVEAMKREITHVPGIFTPHADAVDQSHNAALDDVLAILTTNDKSA